MTEGIIGKAELESLGLYGESVHLFEYDLPSGFSDPAQHLVSSKYTSDDAKFMQRLRNNLNYRVKLIIRLPNNLASSWFVPEDKLEDVRILQKDVQDKLIARDMEDFARKVKIITIYVSEEVHETFETRKQDFYLAFIAQTDEKIDEAMKDLTSGKEINGSVIWLAKKHIEVITEEKETIEDKTSADSRYQEITDLLSETEDSLTKLELKYEEFKDAKKAEKALAKKGITKVK